MNSPVAAVAETPNATPQAGVKCNGKFFVLGKSLPLTLGDWKKLEAGGVSAQTLIGMSEGAISVTALAHVFYVLLSKQDPEITVEHVDQIPFDEEHLKVALQTFDDVGTDAPPASDPT